MDACVDKRANVAGVGNDPCSDDILIWTAAGSAKLNINASIPSASKFQGVVVKQRNLPQGIYKQSWEAQIPPDCRTECVTGSAGPDDTPKFESLLFNHYPSSRHLVYILPSPNGGMTSPSLVQ